MALRTTLSAAAALALTLVATPAAAFQSAAELLADPAATPKYELVFSPNPIRASDLHADVPPSADTAAADGPMVRATTRGRRCCRMFSLTSTCLCLCRPFSRWRLRHPWRCWAPRASATCATYPKPPPSPTPPAPRLSRLPRHAPLARASCTARPTDLTYSPVRIPERCLTQFNKNPWELLAPMREYCLYRPTGWWTYELCYGTHVKQFHDDAERKQPRVEFLLGVPPAAADGVDVAPPHTEATDAHGNRYYSERYLDGTVCDLTSEPRKTEIRFTCDATKAEHIAVLKETSTCQYLLVVQTPRLCTHPLYRPREGVALPIQCQQVLSDAEWAEYLNSGGGAVHSAPVCVAVGRNEHSVVVRALMDEHVAGWSGYRRHTVEPHTHAWGGRCCGFEL